MTKNGMPDHRPERWRQWSKHGHQLRRIVAMNEQESYSAHVVTRSLDNGDLEWLMETVDSGYWSRENQAVRVKKLGMEKWYPE